MRSFLAVAAVGLAVVPTSGSRAFNPIRCDAAARVDPAAPLGHAVALGKRLWLAIYPYSPGYPNKVIVAARRALPTRIEIRGFQCSTGRPLRFWYRDGLPGGRIGSLRAVFGPWSAGGMRGGYFLFQAPGNWKIVARTRGRVVATVVVATWS